MKNEWWRFPFMVAATLLLLIGLYVGLQRLGWQLPTQAWNLMRFHGHLLVCAFLGTLIGVERASALGKAWSYWTPAFAACSGIFLLLGMPHPIPSLAATAASMVLAAIFVTGLKRHRSVPTLMMTVAAILWFGGNLVWTIGKPTFVSVPWWAGFLVLTIVAERVELGHLWRSGKPTNWSLLAGVSTICLGIFISFGSVKWGFRILGVGFLMLALWLLRFDIARRTIRQPGLPKYVAVALLTGYFWLGISGLLVLVSVGVVAGPRYDATLHALFVGFVFSLIFGHAPLILPALVKSGPVFNRILYLPLLLLHFSLAGRVIGDLLWLTHLRLLGGLLSALAIVLLFVFIAGGKIKKARQQRKQTSKAA